MSKNVLPDAVTTQIRISITQMRSAEAPPKNWRLLLEESAPIQEIYVHELEEKAKTQGLSGNVSNISSLQVKQGSQMTYDSAFYERYSNPEIVEKLLFDYSSNEVPVRLYISQLGPQQAEVINNMGTAVRFMISNKLVGIWGASHVGFQLGNKLVHFLDNHFVKIQEVKARNALYVSRLSTSGTITLSPELKKKVAGVVVKWNTTKHYLHESSNCQHFVEELVNEMNSVLKPAEKLKTDLTIGNPKLAKLLKTVLENPAKVGFKFFDEYQNTEIEFHDHLELDSFELQHKDRLSEVDKTFLKGFHRAFQMRENSNSEDFDCAIHSGYTFIDKISTIKLEDDLYIKYKYKKEFPQGKEVDQSFKNRYLAQAAVKASIFSSPQPNSLFNINLYRSFERGQLIRGDPQQVPIQLYIFKGEPNSNDFDELRQPHVGIQIGDKIFRFLSNHFVDVVPFDEGRALYIISLFQSGSVTMSEELQTAVSSQVYEWNRKYYYVPGTNDSFRFVREMCARINRSCNTKLNEMNDSKFLKNFIFTVCSLEPEKVPLNKVDKVYFEKDQVDLSSYRNFHDWMVDNGEELNKDGNRDFQQFVRGFGYALQLNEFLDEAAKKVEK